MYSPSGSTTGQGYFPYITTNNVNPLRPFFNSTTIAGPFQSQDNLTSLKAPDVCNVRFINTMNSLTSSGKVISSIYYEPLDTTWFLPLDDTAAFTTQGLLNNYGFVRQYSM